MSKFYVAILACMLLYFNNGIAQHQELNEDPKLWGKSKKSLDSNNLLHQFQMGTMHGHFRSFFSTTANKNSDIDYANAVGGGIQFISKPIYNINIGVSGFFVYDAFSSDLTKPHPLSNTLNRYELGLFDVTNPANKNDIDRLEELFIQYNNKNTKITIGKQLLNTPFINLQDGRMRPTEVQGFWGQYKLEKSKWYAGWLNRFSPRGTVEWYKTSESIGIYSVGVNQDGSKSEYKNNLESSGVALAGTEISLNKKYRLQIWNQYVENIFNSSFIQLDKIPTNYDKTYFGIQLIRQMVINNGGNEAINKTYFNPSQSSLVIGGKIGQQIKQWDHSLNYTRITKSGRYLMPREWGRDPFYT
ncbi:MAG: OprD family outer membrane porin, partial [Sediminibacterium sp.]